MGDAKVIDSGPEVWPPRMLRPRRGGRVRVWDALERALDPLEWRPRLADHVELKDFELRWGNDYTIIANRRDLLYFRLEPAEAAVIRRFDGRRSVGEVVGEHLDDVSELSLAGFAELMLQLRSSGMFTDGGGDVDQSLARALTRGGAVTGALNKVVRSQPIEWRGVEKPTVWMYRHGLRFAFHPVGAVLIAIVAIGGFASFLSLTWSSDYALVGDSPALEGAVLILMSYVLGVCHEIGHAIVLVHHGRRVKSAGFMIYFGSPALFIDSSDGLMLDQRQRIQQSFAGPYTEMALAGAAALVAFSFPGSAVGETLFRFAVLNYFVLFLNLVPLLELDGYWIFSDLVQLPDLRPRSLAFVRHELWGRLRHRQRLTRQEAGLAIYGTLGVAFTAFSFYGAFFFWRHILGGLIGRLWRSGPLSRALLVLLAIVVAGPVLRAGIDAGRAAAKVVKGWSQQVRFRLETAWRVEAAELLAQSPVFDDLEIDVLDDLAGRVSRASIPAGAALFEQGDRATALYVVRRGVFAMIQRDLETGRERTLRMLGRGEVVGELGLLGQAPRSATIRATTGGEVFVVPKGAFDRLLADAAVDQSFRPSLQELDELRTITCFTHLSTSELAQVRENGRWLQVAPGESVVTVGETADAFYGVSAGQVEVVVGRQVAEVLGAGSWFGERGLLSNSARQATVRARTPARLFRLERQGFDDLLRAAFHATAPPTRRLEQRSWEH